VVVGIGWLYYGRVAGTSDFVEKFLSLVMSFYAILIGFNLVTMSILVTMDLSKTPLLKKDSDRKIMNLYITWYKYVLLNVAYSTVAGVFVLFAALLFYLFLPLVSGLNLIKIFIIGFISFGVLHSLLVTIRNTTNLYVVFSKKEIE
jgi:hypothetical protein